MGQWFGRAQLGWSGGSWAAGLLNPVGRGQLTSAPLGSHHPTHWPEIADPMVGKIPDKAELLRASGGPAPTARSLSQANG